MPSQAVLELLIYLRDEASSQIGAVQGQVASLSATVEQVSGGEGGLLGRLFANATNIASTVSLIGDAFNLVTTAVGGFVADAQEANGLLAQTNAVITSTGGAAGVSAQHVVELATALSAASGQSLFGDAQIQQSTNMLLTFTNIKGAVLDAATAISVDMAQALGGEPQAQAIALGKALNDPVKGVTALTRVGVTFTEEQKKMIAAMVQTGDVAGAQNVILTELQHEFGGSAAAAAAATGGMAQFKDRMGEAAETVAGALLPAVSGLFGFLNSSVAPIIEGLASGLATLIGALLGSTDAFAALSPAAQEVVAVLMGVGQFLADFAANAYAWGAGLIEQYGAGILDGLSFIWDAINSIGAAIASLMAPGSPPAFLPQIDQWGAGAMSAYMAGWQQGDFSVFNSISDTIKGALDGIKAATGNKGMDVAGMVLGDQANIAAAIEQVRTMGSVSQDTFDAIIAGAGPAGPQVAGLVRSYIDLEAATQNVKQAQDELNSVTEEYASKLTPLNAELKQLQDKKQAISDAQKLAELNAKAADMSLSAQDREAAALDAQIIMKRQQIRATEDERDVAVDAAKQKLDAAKQQQKAAQDQVASQKALLDAQNKTNKLLADSIKATTAAAGAHHGAAGAAKAHAAAQTPLGTAINGVNNALGTGQKAMSDTQLRVTAVANAIRSFLAPAFQFLSDNAGGVIGALAGVASVLIGIPAALAVLSGVGSVLAVIGGAIAFLVSPLGLLIAGMALLGAAIGSNFMGLGTAVAGIVPLFQALAGVLGQTVAAFNAGGLAAAFQTLIGGLGTVGAMLGAWAGQIGGVLLTIGVVIAQQVVAWGQAFIGWVAPMIGPALAALGTLLSSLLGAISSYAPVIAAQLLAWGQAFIDFISPYIPVVLAGLEALGSALVGAIVTYAPLLAAQLLSWGQAFVDFVSPYIPVVLAGLADLASSLFGWISAQVAPLLAQFALWGQALVDWIVPATVAFLAAWPGMLSSFLDWIGGAVGPLLAQLGMWALAFVQWVAPAIPGILAAVAGIAAALLVWIGETVGVLAAKLLEWGLAFIGWVAPQIPGMLAALGGFIVAALGWIAQQVGVLAAALVQWGVAFIAWIGPQIPGIVVALGGIAQGILGWIATVGPRLLVAAAQWGMAFIAWIAPKIPGIVTALGGIMVAIAGWIGQQTARLATALAVWAGSFVGWVAKDVIPKIPGELAKIITAINGWVNGAQTALAGEIKKLGTSLVQGIQAGISEEWIKFTSWLTAQVQKIPEPIRSAMGIHSPSSVMASAVGLPIVQGVGEGMLQGIPTINVATAKIIGATADALSKIVQTVQAGVQAFAEVGAFTSAPIAAVQRFVDSITQVVLLFAQAQTLVQGRVNQARYFSESAKTVVDLIKSGVDAFAALKDFTFVPTQVVQAFVADLAFLMQILIVATLTISKGTLANAALFASTAQLVIDLLKSGIEAFALLKDFAPPTEAAVVSFVSAVAAIVQFMGQAASTFSNEGLGAAVTFAKAAETILGILKDGVEGLKALATFTAPSATAVLTFVQASAYLVDLMRQAAGTFSEDGLAAAQAFAQAAQAVLAVIHDGIDGLMALRTFVAAPAAAVLLFVQNLAGLVGYLAQAGSTFSTDAYAAATAFTTAARAAVGLIKDGLDGLTLLRTYTAVPITAVYAFTQSLADIVGSLYVFAQLWSSEATTATQAFVTAAGSVLGLLKDGVAGFTALATFAAPSVLAVYAFSQALADMVGAIFVFADMWSSQATTATQAFVQAASGVLGLLKNGVEGFAALDGFAAPSVLGLYAFAQAVADMMGAIIVFAYDWTSEATTATQAFVTAAGSVLGLLKNGVEGFRSLTDFVAPSQAAISAFATALGQIVIAIGALASGWSSDALSAAQAFAQAAGAVVGILHNGVQGLTDLATFAGVPEAAIGAFASALNLTVIAIGSLAAGWSSEALAAASAFAQAAGAVVGILHNGVQGLVSLVDFAGVPQAAIDAFATALNATVIAIGAIASNWSADALAAASAFASAAGAVVGILHNGVQGLVALADFTETPQTAIDAFSASLDLVVAAIVTLAGSWSAETLAAATTFATNARTIVDAIDGAIRAFAHLGDFEQTAPDVVAAFTSGLNQLLDVMRSATLPAAGNLGTDLIVGVNNGLLSALPGLLATATTIGQQLGVSIANGLSGALGQVMPVATTVGQNISVGIANGIVAGSSAIMNSLIASVVNALAAAQAYLGIASPSKKASDLIGGPLGEGVAVGITSKLGAVEAAMAQLGGAALSGQQPGLGGAFGAGPAVGPATLGAGGSGAQGSPGGDTYIFEAGAIAPVVYATPGQSATDVATATSDAVLADIKTKMGRKRRT